MIGETHVNNNGEVVLEEDQEYAFIEELLTEKLQVPSIILPFSRNSLKDVLFSSRQICHIYANKLFYLFINNS